MGSPVRPQVFAACRPRSRTRSTSLLGVGVLGPTLLVHACSAPGEHVSGYVNAGGQPSAGATAGKPESPGMGGAGSVPDAEGTPATPGLGPSREGGADQGTRTRRPSPDASFAGTPDEGTTPGQEEAGARLRPGAGGGTAADSPDAAPPMAPANAVDGGQTFHGALQVKRMACAPFAAYQNSVSVIAFSADGKQVTAAGGGNSSDQPTLKTWEVATGQLLHVVPDQNPSQFNLLHDFVVSPDGSLLISAAYDGLALVAWPSGEVAKQITTGDVLAVAISPDGRLLASAALDGWALWSLPDGASLGRWSDSMASDVAITPDGKLLVYAKMGKLELRSLPDGNLVSTLADIPSGNQYGQPTIAMSADGTTLAAPMTNDGSVTIWNLATKAEVGRVLTGNAELALIAMSADGLLLATCDYDGNIKLWRLPQGDLLGTITTVNGTPSALSISPSGGVLAVGFGNILEPSGNLQLFSLPDGGVLNCLYDPKYTQRTAMTVGQERERRSAGEACTCDLVCTCDAVAVAAPPAGEGFVCTCNTVDVGTAEQSSSGSSGGGQYYYPN